MEHYHTGTNDSKKPETSEIRLRKIKETDLMQIAEWRMSPEVTKYMYTDPVLTYEDQLKWFGKIKSDKTCKYWIIEVNGQGIGIFNITNINFTHRRCTWGYYIGSESLRGKGIGKAIECNIYDYIFYILNLNKSYVEVLEDNEKVVALHEKYGCVVEGILKDHIFKNNRFLDIAIMGITKNHWEEIKDNYDYPKIEIED